MNRIAQSTIQEVENKLDALAVVGDYVRLEKKGGRYWGRCPFHAGGQERTPSFTVDPDRKMYYCFGCQQGGSVIKFIMEMDKLSFPEAIETLARRFGVEIIREGGGVEDEDQEKNSRIQGLVELYRGVSVSFQYFLMERSEGEAAKQYILSRGISAELINRFKLGYAPADRGWLFGFLTKKGFSEALLAASGLFSERYPRSSFFSNRLMFPISDRQGRIVAFGGRIIEGDGPKYLNSRETELYHKGQTLFAINLALPEIRRTRAAYLAEGYMDVIALHQAGITNAVAPLGTAFTDDQARLLGRWAEQVNLVFDSDEAGQNAAVKAIMTCRRNGLACRVVVPGGEGPTGDNSAKDGTASPPAKDPADILKFQGPEALQKQMECFILDFEYLVSRGRRLYGGSGSEGKARAIAFLFPYMEALESEVSRDACISAVAGAFGVDRAVILNDYNRRFTGKKLPRPEDEKEDWGLLRTTDELSLLTLVMVNSSLYPAFRREVNRDEIEDAAAKELFIAMEECYIRDENGPDALLSRISSPSLRNYVASKGISKEFSGNPEQLMRDGIKKLSQKKLKRRLSEIAAELYGLEHDPAIERRESRLDELLVEKMHIDTELRRLKEGKI
ncbi:MAG: DNA primase [Treponema sp.]|nr:DNA primase [Treponema sp.]